jgi:hypothetical protein
MVAGHLGPSSCRYRLTMNALTKRRVPLLKTALTHDETKARMALALYLRGWEAVYPGSSAELLD